MDPVYCFGEELVHMDLPTNLSESYATAAEAEVAAKDAAEEDGGTFLVFEMRALKRVVTRAVTEDV